MYKEVVSLISGKVEGILRQSDNSFIPFDVRNNDYKEYLAWLAAGNVVEGPDA